jgi:hypothetical protein
MMGWLIIVSKSDTHVSSFEQKLTFLQAIWRIAEHNKSSFRFTPFFRTVRFVQLFADQLELSQFLFAMETEKQFRLVRVGRFGVQGESEAKQMTYLFIGHCALGLGSSFVEPKTN